MVHRPTTPKPSFIDLELTTACNLRCLHCAINQEGYRFRSLSWGAFERILPFLELHRPTVLLGGHGEPMVHPRFLDVCGALGKTGSSFSLITNGILLTSETSEALLDLAQAGSFIHMTCSIDGVSSETYDRIRRRGRFEVLRGNLLRLAERKRERGIDRPGLSIEVVAMKANQAELPLMPSLAQELGAAELVVADLVEYEGFLNQSLVPGNQALDCLEQMKKAAAAVGILLTLTPGLVERLSGPSPTGVPAEADGIFSSLLPELDKDRSGFVKDCDDPWTKIFIGSNGDVRPCCFLSIPMGSLLDEDLSEIWDGYHYRTIRHLLRSPSPLTVCRLCFARGWRPAERPGRIQKFNQMLRDGAERITNPYPAALQPKLTLEPKTGIPGTPFSLTLELTIEGEIPRGTFDVHVFATGPDDRTCHWLLFPRGGRKVPFLQGWRATPLGPWKILETTIPDWPAEEAYSWTAVVTRSGADILNRKTWIGSHCTSFTVEARAGSFEGENTR